MRKVKIRMSQREGKIAELLIGVWLALFLLAMTIHDFKWKWFLSYTVIGIIAFIIFGEYKYRKGYYEVKKPHKNDTVYEKA